MEENQNQEPVQETNNVEKKNNSLALTSFIFSLVGILIAGLPCGLVAVITGIIGLVKFDPNKEKGKGLAIAGLVIGIIDVVVMVIYLKTNFSTTL